MSAYDAVVMVALNDPRHVPAADPGLDRLARAVTGSPADVVRVGLRRGLALPGTRRGLVLARRLKAGR